jgi:putative acetyltransferase
MSQDIIIRNETAGDLDAIIDITMAAFKDMAVSQQTEHLIIAALRTADALSLSLVAEIGGVVAGSIAFSPVSIAGGTENWYGLGPVSVIPSRQKQGIGKALVTEGLSRLRELGANGCCLAGHPGYYKQFGFENVDRLSLEGVPPVPMNIGIALSFDGNIPKGKVTFHKAFATKAD